MAFDPSRCLVLAAEGKSLKQMALAMECDPSAIYQARAKSPSFDQSFQLARLNGLELLADDLITIDQEVTDVLRARLRSENLRWLLSKRIPHQYGDRIAVDVSGTVDLRAALTDANKRLDAIDAEFKEVLPAPSLSTALAPVAPALSKLLE